MEINHGIVYTNENCIGCNHCISGCPVPGANIAQVRNGRNVIVVDGDKCIHCGHCIVLCRHFAREYIDDTSDFISDLKNGKHIALAVDPAFYIDYPDEAPMVLGYLRKLGARKIYNVSVGGDIATWAYCRWFSDNPDRSGITEPCAATVQYIERHHPEFLGKLVPVKSPLMCLATYVRKYLGEQDSIAYISPCITEKDEIDNLCYEGLVQYNVTFQHLFMQLSLVQMMDRANVSPAVPDLPDFGLGSIFPMPGGLKQNLEHFLGYDRPVISMSNIIYLFPFLGSYDGVLDNNLNPVIMEPLCCEHGCMFGSGIDTARFDMKTALAAYNKKRTALCAQKGKNPDNPYCRFMPVDMRIKVLDEHFKDLDISDFFHTYENHAEYDEEISADRYEEIFTEMHKYSPESRHIDCQRCGYNSCRDMVNAVAKGYNRISNCSYYEHIENIHLITTNPVTNLPNTGMFHRRLGEMLEQRKLAGFSVLYFNVRNFLLVNKRFGFNIGTEVLVEFSQTMLDKMDTDESFFHAGGDTFFAIIKNEHVNSIIFEMNHLDLKSLSTGGEDKFSLSMRCGVYQLTGRERCLEDIVNPVNVTYMVAKKDPIKDVAFYDETIASSVMRALFVTQQIPRALASDELSVVFQPKVSTSGRMLVGAEALVRWMHDGKMVSPGDFIPECETNGFIKKIDFYVLNRVCETIAEWTARKIVCVPVSVNFSKLHFTDDDLAERICNVIDRWHISHELIEIECTETSFIDSRDTLRNTIDCLKEKGIRASIDDFGTGYSSLSLLQNLHFSVLKFDKTFIDSIIHGQRSETVIRDIIRMANDLDMEVVAEGVETQDKFELLSLLGCDVIQGYYFDKPLLPGEFEKRLLAKKYS